MDRYKLYNTIRSNELDHFETVTKERFSYSRLKDLFDHYELVEFVEKHYCCYGEDFNCWIDEDLSWTPRWWTQEYLNRRFYKQVKHIVHRLERTYKTVNIFRCENEDCICVVIPSRTITKSDYYICFKK